MQLGCFLPPKRGKRMLTQTHYRQGSFTQKIMQRNDLDANCQLLKAYYIGQGKDCETKEVSNYCQKTRGEIVAQIDVFDMYLLENIKDILRFPDSYLLRPIPELESFLRFACFKY